MLRAAEAGDGRRSSAVIDVGRWLGVGLAGLVNVFDPQVVVLGGLFGRMAPLVAADRHAELDARALSRRPASRSRVVVARWAIDAPVLGAAERAFEPLLADPLCRLARRARSSRQEAAMANV